jgi:hypothetical protein
MRIETTDDQAVDINLLRAQAGVVNALRIASLPVSEKS